MEHAMVLNTPAQPARGVGLMPLMMADAGERLTVAAIKGRDDSRQFLAGLGFVPGAEISVVNEMAGNLIVEVKGARVALSRQMVQRIMVERAA